MRIRMGRALTLGSSLAIGALSAGAVVSDATAVGHGGQASCGPRPAQTLVADRVARIYGIRTGKNAVLYQGGPHWALYNYYGCAVGGGKSELLARASFSAPRVDRCHAAAYLDCVREIRLVGTIVGYIADAGELDTSNGALTVRDLTTRRVLHIERTSFQQPDLGQSIIRFVLARSGNIAWVTRTASGGPLPGDNEPAGSSTIRRAIGQTVDTLD
ncbi:MAG: hypothetical protein JO156_06785, partial [Solirubrobacterales bacterium]|nr:hypothetical protein [Solirubrobacterales bacterium]